MNSVFNLIQQIELMKHSLQLHEQKIKDSTYAQIMNEISAIEAQLLQWKQVILIINIFFI